MVDVLEQKFIDNKPTHQTAFLRSSKGLLVATSQLSFKHNVAWHAKNTLEYGREQPDRTLRRTT
ncbi:MAG TPA: hypothetical protein DCR06_08265 [Planctomycetaceae bacterium]|jgi:hypothetical protein|nr:MAG: hypothetical protein CBC98_06885 [Planctomycetaceae bacterium TMED138]HAO72583.1 hypothetical protein [Planctomycetaceae bacterium]